MFYVGCSRLQAASSWLYIDPYGIYNIVQYIQRTYNDIPMFITENGMVTMVICFCVWDLENLNTLVFGVRCGRSKQLIFTIEASIR